MSRTSLTDQLVDLRRVYTGENLSQAVPAIKAALSAFTADDRDRVVDALRGRAELPERLRGELLPEALSTPQRELESALLRVASDAAAHLQLRPPASMLRPAHALRAVEPFAVPRVHLADHALGPLLYELLPRLEETWVAGLAGLRVRKHPRAVELHVLDDPDARIVLAGVDAAAWDTAMKYVHRLLADRGLTSVFVEGDLTEPERAHLAEHGRTPGPAGLGSSLLRRVHLFADAPWLRSWSQGAQWWLEWPAGLGLVRVADRLSHGVFGLPGAVEAPASAGGLGLSVGADLLFLREVEGPDPANEEALASFEWPDGVTGWAAIM
ncbi:hypothetical protein ACFFQW_14125 [Umezawaea endophytica]|uniref:Uncharacterized protein n=1 Tax=Umezawaea endophytica TaxID=1654476 RepID=A0A9X3AF28_9PSEU|nr:hypothetical protein [Umezawaea endophytica]MCS7478157.1 hypothetical protein [Umezawaea endophytica]